jgi:hypothetical protein
MRLTFIRTAAHVAASLLLVFSLPCPAEPAEPDSSAGQVNILVGSIEDDRYIARNKSFSFKLPVKASAETLKGTITDAVSPAAHVITIKSANQSSNYRFEVSRVLPGDKDNSNFTQATAKTFDWYRRLIQRAWRRPLSEIVNEEFDWNGHRAAHAIYKQFADAESGPRYHIFYLADFGHTVSFLWTNISLPEENLEAEDAIIAASSGPALRAKQSFLSFQLD